VRTRTKARQRAVEALFEAEQRNVSVTEVFERNPSVNEYAISIASVAFQNRTAIDDLINTYSIDWPVDRMPAVDRAILRVAVAELLFEKNLDTNVIIAEALEVAKSLSTEDSVKFINGILANVGSVRNSLSTW
jgi:N utilization substance protein B